MTILLYVSITWVILCVLFVGLELITLRIVGAKPQRISSDRGGGGDDVSLMRSEVKD